MDWFRRMMMGRYGNDQLSVALFVLYFILWILAQILHIWVLVWIAMIPLVLCFYRMFSRNTSRRYKENYEFLKFWNPIKAWFKKTTGMIKGLKYYRYYKCPNCSHTLRVPKGKGKICITCPVCRKEFVKKT
jgi:hypothetical protein